MKQRNILLAIAGLSPQVITETLYALAVLAAPEQRFIPDEIHVVTTAQGADRIKLLLLSEKPGWFHRMRRDFQLPNITLDTSTLHTIEDAQAVPLEDIRNSEDNTRVADKLTQLIAEFTQDPNTNLHVSIAGGRKTMGFFAGYALSLFARPQDRLSHVLISPEFESHPEFFYPTPYQHIIIGRDHAGTPLDAQQAQVELAELPVVSLRNGLPERVLTGDASYSDAVAEARRALEPARIEISGKDHFLAGVTIPFTPREACFYRWFLNRTLKNNANIVPNDPHAPEQFLVASREIIKPDSASFEQLEHALKDGFEKDYFNQLRAKTNKAIKEALGAKLAERYLIGSFGPNNYKYYALGIEPGAIGKLEKTNSTSDQESNGKPHEI